MLDQEQHRHEADALAGCEVQDAEVDPGARGEGPVARNAGLPLLSHWQHSLLLCLCQNIVVSGSLPPLYDTRLSDH